MKDSKKILLWFFISIILFSSFLLLKVIVRTMENKEFLKSAYMVATKDENNNKISFYEINNRKKARKINKIEYVENDMFYLNNCFDSYSLQTGTQNSFLEDSCKVVDKNKNTIEYNDEIKNIIILISKLDHPILSSKVLDVNGKYFVVVEFNVNLWSPYKLYKFEDGKLKHIITFNGEEVIYIKETNIN